VAFWPISFTELPNVDNIPIENNRFRLNGFEI